MPVTAKSIAEVRYGESPAACSPEEWRTRVDPAACYRLIHHYGWTSQVYNHITARIPGTGHLLINGFGLAYDEIRASNRDLRRRRCAASRVARRATDARSQRPLVAHLKAG